MEIIIDASGNQTLYTILGDLKNGDNTLTFSVDELHPEYKVTINKGESSDAVEEGTGSDKDNNSAGSNGSTSNGGATSNGGNSANNRSTAGNKTTADSTVENPKTGIVTYTLIILGVAAIAGGTYYYLRKKNILKKI